MKTPSVLLLEVQAMTVEVLGNTNCSLTTHLPDKLEICCFKHGSCSLSHKFPAVASMVLAVRIEKLNNQGSNTDDGG